MMNHSNITFTGEVDINTKEDNMKTEKLNIEGMHCGHCSALVKNSLSIVKGVKSSDVQVGSVIVEYDENITERSKLEDAVTRFGYKIKE